MKGKLRRSIPAIALSLFTVGNVSAIAILSTVLAGVGILIETQNASAYIVGGGYQAGVESYSFEDISTSGTGILNNANDNTTNRLNIPFAFRFFGVDYNEYRISSNGFLALGNPSPNAARPADDARADNLDLNTASGIGPIIAPYWDNLTATGSGRDRAYYEVKGTAGSRRLIVQWNKFGYAGSPTTTGDITFQAILFEGSNNIVFSYADTFFEPNSAVNNGGSATVGISDGSGGSNRLQWSYNSAFSQYAPPQAGPTVRFQQQATPLPPNQ
jgi:hypothetical protein